MNTLSIVLIILAAVAGIAFLMLFWYGMSEARKNGEHRRQMERAGRVSTRPKGRPDFYEEA